MGINMAKIAKPRQELIYLWRQANPNYPYFPYISRAYYRESGKFIPYGWHLDDRRGTVLTFSDADVAGVSFADIFS